MRKLQISLPDFRRLCIYKGIYPREPRNKRKASKSSTPSTTFYYTKDIQYLLHEPILKKFRDHKALAKKIARSLGRGEVGDAARLEKIGKPRITLDHIIKERYPTFVDALRDLDDALSLLFLFASLPATSNVPPKTIALCQRLCLEFQHYLITTHALRKSFLSIKGIYYQATIQGQDVLWLVPYRFVQRVTGDVDFRIMGTFVEFYTTLLGFVNYRLFTSVGLVYPPKFNAKSDEQCGELDAFTLEGQSVDVTPPMVGGAGDGHTNGTSHIIENVQAHVDDLTQRGDISDGKDKDGDLADDGNEDTIDTFEVQGEGADILDQPQRSDIEIGTLFSPYSFFLSRETPRQPLEFILRAFGCKRIGWDAVLGDGAFTHDEMDASITHQVVDRPLDDQSVLSDEVDPDGTASVKADLISQPKKHGRMPGRTYIQPQWVWDCINECKLLRPDLYAPGAILPPHLSPWVKQAKSIYDPTLPLIDQEKEGEAEEAQSLNEDEQQELDELVAGHNEGTEGVEIVTENHGMDVAGDTSDGMSEDDFGGFESDPKEEATQNDEDEEEIERSQYQQELEAEAAGLVFTQVAEAKTDGTAMKSMMKTKGEEARKQAAKRRKDEAEEVERRKMMLSKNKRKLYEKMVYSNKQKDDEAAKLRSKRRKMEVLQTQR